MNKILKSVIFVLLAGLAAYHSVYFRPLDEVLEAKDSDAFDASVYTRKFWSELTAELDDAVPLETLLKLLEDNPEKTFSEYSNVLGIGNVRFFLTQSTGQVIEINSDHLILEIESGNEVRLATDYIFGNAVRDASGLIDVNEFSNTMYFNEVSSRINQRISEDVLPPFLDQVSVDDKVTFAGALELHQIFFDLKQIEIIPIRLQINPSGNE